MVDFGCINRVELGRKQISENKLNNSIILVLIFPREIPKLFSHL